MCFVYTRSDVHCIVLYRNRRFIMSYDIRKLRMRLTSEAALACTRDIAAQSLQSIISASLRLENCE